MRALRNLLAQWQVIAVTAALCLSIGFGAGWVVRGWKAGADDADAARAEVKATAEVVTRTQGAAVITQNVGQAVEARRVETRTVYRTIREEIPVHVPAEVDRDVVVPVGFVRLHDAAAAGDPSALSDRAGQPDDAPSGVALSAVAATVVDNYGTCADLREQVIGWQDWWRAQAAGWETSG